MNRCLWIPAIGCLAAFVLSVALFSGARDGNAAPQPASAPVADVTPRSDDLLAAESAERVLAALADDYLQPWRAWEQSPRRLFSRAMPRRIPPIEARIELAGDATGPSDGFLLASVAITTGDATERVPCVVDRVTQRVRFFAEQRWLTEDEWLALAPLPPGAPEGFRP
jgi:hypothetical protein